MIGKNQLKAFFKVDNIGNHVFLREHYKTVKNRPICIQLTVLKLPEFVVFKTPEFFNTGIPPRQAFHSQGTLGAKSYITQNSN